MQYSVTLSIHNNTSREHTKEIATIEAATALDAIKEAMGYSFSESYEWGTPQNGAGGDAFVFSEDGSSDLSASPILAEEE